MNIEDPSLVRAFYTVAQHGSFTAAARVLNSTQPTLTRQIQALEQQTGLHLFERSNKGLTITQAGERLVEVAEKLVGSLDEFNRLVAGQEREPEGVLRVSANEVVGHYLLPKALQEFRLLYPSIQIELMISNELASLSQREADIAFRMLRPTQPDLVGRRLTSLPLGIFATKQCVQQYGKPKSLDELLSKPTIGYDKDPSLVSAFREFGVDAKQQDFSLRTDSLLMQIAFLKSHAGFAVTHPGLCKLIPDLVTVLKMVDIPELQFWLVSHSDIQYSKKIRVAMEFLGDWFTSKPYNQLWI